MFDPSNAGAREAGIKYYYLSTFSSGLLLYGLFLLYTVAKQGQFDILATLFATNNTLLVEHSTTMQFSIVFVLLGLFFKLSAVPGHFWAAEVYDGSPSPVMTLFILPVKIAVLGFTLNLFTNALTSVIAY
jgi:NADH-quinone oxidoreductase subunit N